MVKLLIANGAEIDRKDYQNNTAYSYAKEYRHTKIIRYLNQNNSQKTTPLGSTIQQKTVIKTDNTREIPHVTLCSAIEQNNFELVKSLVENDDEDLCEVDNAGNTPLMIATRVKNQNIVKYLLENGANLTVHSAVPIAIEENDFEILKILLVNCANINKYYKSIKQTPLMQAISLKNLKMVQFLIENGANPNLNPALLQTAIELKCYKILKYLIENGADVKQSSSLLKLAIKQKNFRIIVLLVNHGADVKNDIDALKQFSEENDDFLEFFNEKIASKFKVNKNETKDD